jgi:Fe-S-cluster-containing dehydrogenase component/formate-dependent nitrite reductase membrane component NrfD
VRYGFVIDQRRCIGCHACTVACKEENQVPLGVFRTWVKYVERGRFPDTRRYFSVLRCNHCDRPPCVTICPTGALYRRPDGIVDLDSARCIGCKACMQACPYDALYLDPASQTAAKCHYCAHRIEVGLEPACAVVCPVQAIVAGDLDDPASRIARLVAAEPIQVRKADEGTQPKVFYVGGDAASLSPGLQPPATDYMWAERPAEELSLLALAGEAGADGARPRPVYDVPHRPRPWGRRVSGYLWTKSVAAGTLLAASLGAAAGRTEGSALTGVAAPLLALLFLVATAALLVADLTQPARAHLILLKPNRRSWLVWGSWILIAYGAVATVWLLAGLAGSDWTAGGWLPRVTLLLAAAAAGYSAFLFGQAEGRDFWQSPIVLPQLVVAALVAGAASLIVLAAVAHLPTPDLDLLATMLGAGLVLEALLLLADVTACGGDTDRARAARLLTRGSLAGRFWNGVVLTGVAAPLALLAHGGAGTFIGALLALTGLWIYEDLWVRVGQAVPLS